MNPEEHKFYLYHGTSAFLYRATVIGFFVFAVFYVYLYLGLTLLAGLVYALICFLLSIVAYPFFIINSPLYAITSEGIKQNKYWYLPKQIPWSEIKSISYPTNSIIGSKGNVSIEMASLRFGQKLMVGLSDIDRPYEFLSALNIYKPFGLKENETKIYLERYEDREKIFYISLLYICIGVAVLLLASYYMPYIILEDNKYKDFWGALFFLHLIASIAISILVHKDILARKSFLKVAIFLWIFIFIGPLVADKGTYYNVKALRAEQRKDYSEAEDYIRKAISPHPEGYSYHETLGKILFHRGKYEEAIEEFDFLLDNDKRLTEYYIGYYNLWIGKSLWKLGKHDEAEKMFKKVKALNREDLNREVEAVQRN